MELVAQRCRIAPEHRRQDVSQHAIGVAGVLLIEVHIVASNQAAAMHPALPCIPFRRGRRQQPRHALMVDGSSRALCLEEVGSGGQHGDGDREPERQEGDPRAEVMERGADAQDRQRHAHVARHKESGQRAPGPAPVGSIARWTRLERARDTPLMVNGRPSSYGDVVP